MKISTLCLSLFLFLLVSMTTGNAIAQWTNDSTLNTEVRGQSSATVTMIATAQNGNSFISWAESNASGGGYQMRMQLVDSNGYNLWAAGGIVLDTMMGSALYRYDLKVDDSGNVIMATQDQSTGDYWPVAFKVDQSGNMLWGASGIQLTDPSATSGLSPVINFTDSNNVLIAWTASGAKSFVSFQKLAPDGTFLWADNGNIIDPGGAVNYERAQIVRKTGEQFLIQYVKRSGFGLGVSTMYAQSYDGQANTVWANPTEVSTSSIGFAAFPAPVPDGYGGFFITFTSGNPSSASLSEAYAQRVYSDGHIWGGVGTEMGLGTVQQRFDEGGIYVPSQNEYFAAISVTDNSQGSSGVSMQAIDTAGNVLLPSNPLNLVPLSNGTNATIIYVTGIKDIDTGVVILYEVGTTPSPVIIKAIETDYNGNFKWADTAVTVSAAQSDKLKYEMGNYTHGQIVVAWTDQRTPDGGVYAQNIIGNGYLGTTPFVCPTIIVSADTVAATVGTAYNDTVSQAGGVGTITYTVTNGALPSGVTLSSTGVLSGTTLASGTYTFTVTATDSDACTGSQTDTLVVSCPTVSLATLSSICDTAAPLTLTGGIPAGGVYSGTGVSSGVFTPVTNDTGTFNITYTYTIGNCVDSATQSIVVTPCANNTDTSTTGSGVKNITSLPSFQCLPNPSNGIIVLKINGHIAGDVTVKMLDMAGRVMWTDVQGVNGAYSKTFNISNYPKGIYMLQASCAENSNTMKIVLQ